jgi:hypothetical protein
MEELQDVRLVVDEQDRYVKEGHGLREHAATL